MDKDHFEEMEGWNSRSNIAERSHHIPTVQSNSRLLSEAASVYTNGNNIPEQSHDLPKVDSDSTWIDTTTSVYTNGNKTPEQICGILSVQSGSTWLSEATSMHTKRNKTPEQSYDPSVVQSDLTWFGDATSIYTKGEKTPEQSYDPSVVQSDLSWFGDATSIYTKGEKTPEQSYDPPKIQSDSTRFEKAISVYTSRSMSGSTKQNGLPELHDVKSDSIFSDVPFSKDKYLQITTKQYDTPEHSDFSSVKTALSKNNDLSQTNYAGMKKSPSKDDFKLSLVKKVNLNAKEKVYTDKKANMTMNFERITRGFGIIGSIIVLGIIATWICLLFTLFEILMLKSDVSTLQNQLVTFTSVQKIINTSIAQLSQNYSGFEQSSSKFDETVNSQFSFQYQRYPTQSCLEILKNNSSSPSGYYWVKSSSGNFIHVFCDMTRSCGGVIGGWMRVTKLNMADSATSECPPGLVPNKSGSIHSCVPKDDGPSCSSIYFSVNNITYSKVCGTIRSYQQGTPDAFLKLKREDPITIDSNYVDGISLTYGINPRKHIWTLAAGPCPCNRDKPDFVSGNLFCDGVPHSQCNGICIDVLLWDGIGCTTQTSPWFYRDLQTYITEEIEMRVCHDESRTDEDIPIQLIELYIQ